MSEPSPIVRVRDLRKVYGDLEVLKGLSLEVPPAQRLAIIGPSGSGKSTLLRLLMTLERPDGGTLEVDGEELWHERRNGRRVDASPAHVARVRGKVGMVFQHFNLFPHMTVLENVIEAPVQVLGLAREEARARGMELLRRVGLEDKVDARPGQLSGGQKQRTGIARALAMRPKVMLFDEVTSALDPELVGEVLSVLRGLAEEGRMTMLIVTHQMNFAAQIADRVAFFDGGRILEDGPPGQVLKEPREERTRAFLRAVLEST